MSRRGSFARQAGARELAIALALVGGCRRSRSLASPCRWSGHAHAQVAHRSAAERCSSSSTATTQPRSRSASALPIRRPALPRYAVITTWPPASLNCVARPGEAITSSVRTPSHRQVVRTDSVRRLDRAVAGFRIRARSTTASICSAKPAERRPLAAEYPRGHETPGARPSRSRDPASANAGLNGPAFLVPSLPPTAHLRRVPFG